MRRVSKFVLRPLVVGPLVAVLVASAIGALALRGGQTAEPTGTSFDRSALEPDFIRAPYRAPVLPTPTPTPAPRPAVKPKPRPAKKIGPNITAFRGLGAWVDIYDYNDVVPEDAVADMQAKGVKTLYLQTGRWNTQAKDPSNESFEDATLVARWLEAAHAHGIKVVGWYLPAYDDLARDVRRTVAIAQYRSGTGQPFDALAIDIEYRQQMPSQTAWNAAVAEQARQVRAVLGSKYPIGAITPAPLQMEVRPQYWAGFPWVQLGASADVFMPMAYWSFRDDCSSNPDHCAYGYTKGSVDKVRELTGRPNVPVHVIGGVANAVTTQEVRDFVSAAARAGVYGGSLYDYRTTSSDYWAVLAKLNG